MGFFERNLGAIGEAMDDGLDRARDRSREMCDRRGWSERARDLRERLRDGAAESGRLVGGRWRDIGERGRRRAVAIAAFVGVLVAVAAFRQIAFREKPLPGRAEIELVSRVCERSRSTTPWLTSAADATPWSRAGR